MLKKICHIQVFVLEYIRGYIPLGYRVSCSQVVAKLQQVLSGMASFLVMPFCVDFFVGGRCL